jgi:DNA primase
MIDTTEIKAGINLAELIEADLGPASRAGKWSCPWHEDHTPSLGIVKPDPTRWKCFGCGRSGDVFTWLSDHRGLSFVEACSAIGGDTIASARPTTIRKTARRPARRRLAVSAPPALAWMDRAEAIAAEARACLVSGKGGPGRDYLQRRGLEGIAVDHFRLGYLPADRHEAGSAWGSPDSAERVFLPAGIVIPWYVDGRVWRLNIRRLQGSPKYIGPTGWKNAMFNADTMPLKRPVVMVEGEVDAMMIHQHAGDLVHPIATGSTQGARLQRWHYLLQAADRVILAFDADDAGDAAAAYWRELLPDNAERLRPDDHDPADMGICCRSWILQALHRWTDEERHAFEERAAIYQYCSRMPRQAAEEGAWQAVQRDRGEGPTQ